MDKGWVQRIERETGLPGLVDTLAERLAPTDLRSLLLEVQRRRAEVRTPAELLRQYTTDRFVQPAPGDPLRSLAIEQLAFALLPTGYEALDVAPVAPLGTSSCSAPSSRTPSSRRHAAQRLQATRPLR
ncbi:MAG: hypothetical protein QOH73_2139 [Gaiellaceae bacterium]|jgi:hypothetical protein|nr:hypothetical protein [Gaiellaceae bacterium]